MRIKSIGVYHSIDFSLIKAFPNRSQADKFINTYPDNFVSREYYYVYQSQIEILGYAQAVALETQLAEEKRRKNV